MSGKHQQRIQRIKLSSFHNQLHIINNLQFHSSDIHNHQSRIHLHINRTIVSFKQHSFQSDHSRILWRHQVLHHSFVMFSLSHKRGIQQGFQFHQLYILYNPSSRFEGNSLHIFHKLLSFSIHHIRLNNPNRLQNRVYHMFLNSKHHNDRSSQTHMNTNHLKPQDFPYILYNGEVHPQS